MKNTSKKISQIILSTIILFSIWQTTDVCANSIITPQPIFTTQPTSTQSQNIPNNKSTQKSQTTKNTTKRKTTKSTTKPSVKKTAPKSKTTKPKTVNTVKSTTSRNVNPNSKTAAPTPPKNWWRYITPPIIIITLILASFFTSKGRA